MSKKQINLETSKIPWHELQRFFANGSAIFVCPDIDLIDVAFQFSEDNKMKVEKWLKTEKIFPVTDQQALKWFEEKTVVWAVVVKPWVLIQHEDIKNTLTQEVSKVKA